MADCPRITRISFTPVKGMKIVSLEASEVTRHGIPGDRAFYLVDGRRRMVNAKRFGSLLMIEPEHDRKAGSLKLRFPDGSVCEGPVETGDSEAVTFFGRQTQARPVTGSFSEAISEFIGEELRLMARPEREPAVDRGAIAGITLLGAGSIARLQQAAAEAAGGSAGESEAESAGPGIPGEDSTMDRIDHRRFRMSIEIDGIEPHAEDGWIGQRIKAGGTLLQVNGHVGRCAVTTRSPDTAQRDLAVLGLLRSYRQEVVSEEPLPFGVYASVREPGKIRIGDPVGPVDPA